MPDALGWRMKFGVLAPSTNTSVEPEYAMLQPDGVTNHFCRMWIPDNPINTDEDFIKLVEDIQASTMDAVDRVLTCDPGFIILGVSVETFWDGADRSNDLQEKLKARAGVDVVIGSHACVAALKAYSEDKPIKKLGVITPYMPVGDKQVVGFFNEVGYDVVKIIGLRCKSPVLIAHTPAKVLRDAIKELAAEDVDAIVQVGTNLACMKVADEAERWLAKPVIAINHATYWHGLRKAGITDKIYGHGRLLEEW